MEVKVKRLHSDAVIPSYATDGDACFDLTCVSLKRTENYVQYNTGLAFEIPKGYVGLIFARSSVTKKDLMLKNSVGIIDSGYRGEVSFRFREERESMVNGGENVYFIGDRVGQMMIIPRPEIELTEVEELGESDRGTGGYGSTGK